MELHETQGTFWIPDVDKYVEGKLVRSDKTATLILRQSFDKRHFNAINSDRRSHICCIFGQLATGQYCRLHECNLTFSSPIEADYIFSIDIVYTSMNEEVLGSELNFISAKFRFKQLFDWVEHDHFKIEYNDDRSVRGVVREEKELEFRKLYESEDVDIELVHTTIIPAGNSNAKPKYVLEQFNDIKVTLSENGKMEEFFLLVKKIQELFIFMFNDFVEFPEIIKLSDKQNKKYDCEVYMKGIIRSTPMVPNTSGSYLMINHKNFSQEFPPQELFENWLNNYDQYEVPLHRLIRSMSNLENELEYGLLSIIFAIDALQKIDLDGVNDENYLSSKNIKLLKKLEEQNIDSNTVKSLRASLIKRDRTKLEAKFKHLIDPIGPLVFEKISITQEDFLERLLNTRHSIAHGLDLSRTIDREKYSIYTTVSEAILCALFMKKFGMNDEKINAALFQSLRFRYAAGKRLFNNSI